jgi:lysophospholipase L1-like esterase
MTVSQQPTNGPTSRRLARMLVTLVLSAGSLAAHAAGPAGHWAASWYAAQADYLEGMPPTYPAAAAKMLSNQTLRQLVYVSTTGSQVRLKVSNLFGDTPVTFDAITIGPYTGGAASIDAANARGLTFNRSASVTLAPGQAVFSDPVNFAPQANALVAISVHVKHAAPFRTVHNLALQRHFVALGDVTKVAAPSWSEINDNPNATDPGGFTAWITELDVLRTDRPKVVVAFGDSITDGFGSTPEANHRWPNVLSRLLSRGRIGTTSVVDAGISGNRWKTDWQGPKGEARFERDVLNVSGVTHVVVLLGINDIGYDEWAPEQIKDASDVTAALQAAVAKAKAAGLKVLVGTLLPFKATLIYYSDNREIKRLQVNEFIRNTLKGADAMVDFDQALRDPASPLQLKAAYDSGDHLHPNDAGYTVMAQTVAAALDKEEPPRGAQGRRGKTPVAPPLGEQP